MPLNPARYLSHFLVPGALALRIGTATLVSFTPCVHCNATVARNNCARRNAVSRGLQIGLT
ncbi:hypothetical protein PR003_g11546 [Phytophthora rubi]|uniref:Uncharacterized protein n=1 Tax=Phytophthora rubi TaxID=129364 RepID=A0A6A4FFW8_9STRA|nr:hypothetical protein PR002_g17733 [Phytophthora rubi]KAE9028862.1 hypothetical protein PR001_g11650 [Phytophthora rubi]KAE9338345.1 hypothetical protein PR003_g11546 [Phytophthora rubi]